MIHQRFNVEAIVSTHSRPKAAALKREAIKQSKQVSTHSRPKAADCRYGLLRRMDDCFNTQPPEGGWVFQSLNRMMFAVSTHSRPKAAADAVMLIITHGGFNTQPPEGGCTN